MSSADLAKQYFEKLQKANDKIFELELALVEASSTTTSLREELKEAKQRNEEILDEYLESTRLVMELDAQLKGDESNGRCENLKIEAKPDPSGTSKPRENEDQNSGDKLLQAGPTSCVESSPNTKERLVMAPDQVVVKLPQPKYGSVSTDRPSKRKRDEHLDAPDAGREKADLFFKKYNLPLPPPPAAFQPSGASSGWRSAWRQSTLSSSTAQPTIESPGASRFGRPSLPEYTRPVNRN